MFGVYRQSNAPSRKKSFHSKYWVIRENGGQELPVGPSGVAAFQIRQILSGQRCYARQIWSRNTYYSFRLENPAALTEHVKPFFIGRVLDHMPTKHIVE